jgi:hypothetical protein
MELTIDRQLMYDQVVLISHLIPSPRTRLLIQAEEQGQTVMVTGWYRRMAIACSVPAIVQQGGMVWIRLGVWRRCFALEPVQRFTLTVSRSSPYLRLIAPNLQIDVPCYHRTSSHYLPVRQYEWDSMTHACVAQCCECGLILSGPYQGVMVLKEGKPYLQAATTHGLCKHCAGRKLHQWRESKAHRPQSL